MTKTQNNESSVALFLERFFQWMGKLYSILLPVIAFVLAIAVGRGIFVVPYWPGKVILLCVSLVFLVIGIVLIVMRKKLN